MKMYGLGGMLARDFIEISFFLGNFIEISWVSHLQACWSIQLSLLGRV